MTMNNLPVYAIVANIMSQFLKFPMASGVRISRGTTLRENEVIVQNTTQPLPVVTPIPEKSDFQKVVEHEDERVLAAKRKAEEAKDRATGKRPAPGVPSRQTKKKKTAPISMALFESDADGSTQSGSRTHHSDSPLTTIISDNINAETGGSNLALQSFEQRRRKRGILLTMMMRSISPTLHRLFAPNILSTLSISFILRSMRMFTLTVMGCIKPRRMGTFRISQPVLQTLAQIDILQRYEALNDDYGELYQVHSSCKDLSKRLTKTQNHLVDVLRSMNILSDDHKSVQQVHLGCVGKEAALTEKLAAVEREKEDLLDKNIDQEE
ncbi:hypothetical protein Tco_0608506 [Tanacetum coccineum]